MTRSWNNKKYNKITEVKYTKNITKNLKKRIKQTIFKS